MTLVYRVESPDGTGPFSYDFEGDDDASDTLWDNIDSKLHPAPDKDGITVAQGSPYKFGCKSLDQLKEWFQFAEGLERHGFQVSVYEAYSIQEGKTQLAFTDSYLVDIIPINKIFLKLAAA